uniref:Solute carrier family 2 facilitated glucose n=1 Tax=Echinococcus granulosus TaxID=6210 RepID=A0A068WEZ5_ECHGR|nr:solute carrier family 2 facilitated glucose [Echinococcus granulosus]
MVNFHYVFATVVIVFGSSFQFGFQTGVINSPLPLIEKFIQNICISRSGPPSSEFVQAMSSLVVAGFPIGGIFGALFGGSVSNKVGRKLSLFIFNIPMAIGSLLMMACQAAASFEMIIVGRVLVGFACGAFTGIAPVYLAEIAPVSIRGMSGIMHQLAIVSAILVSQILGLQELMGSTKLWPYLLGLTILPSVVLLLLFWICPDSPRYILLNSRDLEGAKSALYWLRGDTEVVNEEIRELLIEQDDGNENHAVKFPLKDLFHIKALRLALFVAVVAHLAQQFSGINAALFYSTSLFESIGLTSQAVYATLGVGSMIVVITVVSIFLIERVGRRILLIGGLSMMLCSAVIITIGLALRNHASGLVYLAITFIYIFVGGFAIGPGSIPWFVVAELFVQETRDPAIVITVIVNWLAQIKYLKDFSFMPFIGLLVIFIALLYLYLPETKGRPPCDVQEEFVRMASGGGDDVALGSYTHSLPSEDGDNATESDKVRF